jgi:acyl-CoA reductase-like NAD-dependent aldehyde dehydrogenase
VSPFDVKYVLLSLDVDNCLLAINHPAALEYALLEELSFVRRQAQAEAYLAYSDWEQRPSAERYAVYLAAQDRADTAQDELAHYTRRVWGSPPVRC